MIVIAETGIFQVSLRARNENIGSETTRSIDQHLPSHNPLGQLLYPMGGVGVRIAVSRMINIEIVGTNRVLEGSLRAVEPEGSSDVREIGYQVNFYAEPAWVEAKTSNEFIKGMISVCQ